MIPGAARPTYRSLTSRAPCDLNHPPSPFNPPLPTPLSSDHRRPLQVQHRPLHQPRVRPQRRAAAVERRRLHSHRHLRRPRHQAGRGDRVRLQVLHRGGDAVRVRDGQVQGVPRRQCRGGQGEGGVGARGEGLRGEAQAARGGQGEAQGARRGPARGSGSGGGGGGGGLRRGGRARGPGAVRRRGRGRRRRLAPDHVARGGDGDGGEGLGGGHRGDGRGGVKVWDAPRDDDDFLPQFSTHARERSARQKASHPTPKHVGRRFARHRRSGWWLSAAHSRVIASALRFPLQSKSFNTPEYTPDLTDTLAGPGVSSFPLGPRKKCGLLSAASLLPSSLS